eukprot:scaffold1707_cov39-Cyclotella_meneghiniana.AAC.3
MYDGWSKFGRHNVCLLAVWTKKTEHLKLNIIVLARMIFCTALANEEESDDTAVAFNAEIHGTSEITEAFKRRVFETVCSFSPAQCANNTNLNLNPKITRLLGITHVGCRCHSCNGACREMEEGHNDLHNLSAKCQDTASTVKASNKLTATLANVQETAYKMKMMVVTHWMSICDLVNSHIRAAGDLREVAKSNPNLHLKHPVIGVDPQRWLARQCLSFAVELSESTKEPEYTFSLLIDISKKDDFTAMLFTKISNLCRDSSKQLYSCLSRGHVLVEEAKNTVFLRALSNLIWTNKQNQIINNGWIDTLDDFIVRVALGLPLLGFVFC